MTVLPPCYKCGGVSTACVVDCLNLTKEGDEWETFVPLFPVRFTCYEHYEESREYTLKENKNVCDD